MLVMAIKAANQVSDQKSTVLGFNIKDVSFSHALAIPKTTDGIETNLILRQMQDPTDSRLPWSEFHLCSHANHGWQENCHGFIEIKYEAEVNDVQDRDYTVEKFVKRDDAISHECTEDFHHREIYDILKQGGFEFGDSFRSVRSGRYSTRHKARSSVKVFEWSDDQYAQPHIIHPATPYP